MPCSSGLALVSETWGEGGGGGVRTPGKRCSEGLSLGAQVPDRTTVRGVDTGGQGGVNGGNGAERAEREREMERSESDQRETETEMERQRRNERWKHTHTHTHTHTHRGKQREETRDRELGQGMKMGDKEP